MQEESQAIHRFIRPGQIEHALAYRIIALGTTDVTMLSQARAKDLALDAFTGVTCKSRFGTLDPMLIDVLGSRAGDCGRCGVYKR